MGQLNLVDRIDLFSKVAYKTKTKFAEQTGLSPQQLNTYIRVENRHAPSIDIMKRFYRAGMDINWLISGEGRLFSPNYDAQQIFKKKRMEAFIQIVYSFIRSRKFLKEEFLEKMYEMSILLGYDEQETFSNTKAKIEELGIESFNYPNIKKHILGIDITSDVIEALFDVNLCNKYPDYIKKLESKWENNKSLVSNYIEKKELMYLELEYIRIPPWYSNFLEVVGTSKIKVPDIGNLDYFKLASFGSFLPTYFAKKDINYDWINSSLNTFNLLSFKSKYENFENDINEKYRSAENLNQNNDTEKNESPVVIDENHNSDLNVDNDKREGDNSNDQHQVPNDQ